MSGPVPLYHVVRTVYNDVYNAWMQSLSEHGGLHESTRLLAQAAQTVAQAAEHCAPAERDPEQPTQAAPQDPTMDLPAGKTCQDCGHFSRCKWLLSRKGTETACDWSPSRFRMTEDD